MALMSFREPNQVKWVGVRPAHRGTQILQQTSADNATVIIYTVPAGKTFYLVSVALNVATGGVGRGSVFIRDVMDVAVFACAGYAQVATGLAHTGNPSYFPPIEVPAGYDIVVISNTAGVIAAGGIFGWEE